MTELREARDEAERRALMALRHEVFVGEQGVPAELETDEHDATALHLVAVEGGELLGTCRLVMGDGRAKFGRLAVAARARGRGLGSELLAEAERRARAAGLARMALAAQTGAVGLYERAGYAAVGEVFVEAGIDHVTMEKRLA